MIAPSVTSSGGGRVCGAAYPYHQNVLADLATHVVRDSRTWQIHELSVPTVWCHLLDQLAPTTHLPWRPTIQCPWWLYCWPLLLLLLPLLPCLVQQRQRWSSSKRSSSRTNKVLRRVMVVSHAFCRRTDVACTSTLASIGTTRVAVKTSRTPWSWYVVEGLAVALSSTTPPLIF